MVVVFSQVASLFIFIVIGYLLSLCSIVKREHATVLSRMLVWVFLPANVLKTFAKNCTVEYISQHFSLIIISTAVVLALVIIMHFVAKLFSRDSYDRAIYEYSLIIPNYGYMGYAMAESVLGQIGLMNAMMFAVPMSVYVYSAGYCMLSKKKMEFKSLVNPIMVFMVIGMALGLSGIGSVIPEFVYSLLDRASACMAPVSMLLAGIVVSEFDVKKMLSCVRVYILTALRLFVIPVAIGGVIMLLGFSTAAKVAVLLYCMPCGLNTIVFAKNVGGNCEIGASSALISNVLACISIPVVCAIFNI